MPSRRSARNCFSPIEPTHRLSFFFSCFRVLRFRGAQASAGAFPPSRSYRTVLRTTAYGSSGNDNRSARTRRSIRNGLRCVDGDDERDDDEFKCGNGIFRYAGSFYMALSSRNVYLPPLECVKRQTEWDSEERNKLCTRRTRAYSRNWNTRNLTSLQ